MLMRAWYHGARWLGLLWPLSFLFIRVAAWRRRSQVRQQRPFAAPLVVVGNIAVGGTGKTPMVLALVEALRHAGMRPGIISRGYGARPPVQPYAVQCHDSAEHCGDEALMMRRRSDCPVVIDRQRSRAAHWLLANSDCNVIVSDDGLQHYRLWRDVEVVMIDGARGLGNGWCLPAGPLREPAQRLHEVDHVVVTGEDRHAVAVGLASDQVSYMQMQPECWINLKTGEQCAPQALPVQNRALIAMAGIGNPQRFFELLMAMGYDTTACLSFADHHRYRASDLALNESTLLLMTEKDAVKCVTWATDQCWYLRVRAVLEPSLVHNIIARCQSLAAGNAIKY